MRVPKRTGAKQAKRGPEEDRIIEGDGGYNWDSPSPRRSHWSALEREYWIYLHPPKWLQNVTNLLQESLLPKRNKSASAKEGAWAGLRAAHALEWARDLEKTAEFKGASEATKQAIRQPVSDAFRELENRLRKGDTDYLKGFARGVAADEEARKRAQRGQGYVPYTRNKRLEWLLRNARAVETLRRERDDFQMEIVKLMMAAGVAGKHKNDPDAGSLCKQLRRWGIRRNSRS